MNQWDSEEEMTAELIAAGCITDMFPDEDGEMLITWNLQRLKELYPDVYEAVEASMMEDVQETLSDLVDKGLVEMSFNEYEDGTIEAVYSLTPEGNQMVQQEFGDLTDD